MKLDFLKSKWNLLIGLAGGIVALLSGFIAAPYYAAAALSSDANYKTLVKVIVAVTIAIMLVACAFFNKKKNSPLWLAFTCFFVVVAVFIYFKSVTNNKSTTVDYTAYSGSYVVKGDHLFTEKDSLWKEMEKQKGSKLTETEFFAENHLVDDSTGVLTASLLWPKNEIESNAKKIIYYYIANTLLFSLAIIGAVQIVYCVTSAESNT